MSEDEATQKIEELKARAANDFSKDEIESIIQLGKVIASKTVLSALVCVLKEGPSKKFCNVESRKLIKKIEQLMPYNYSGYVQCAFQEIPYVLCICLSIVEKDYVANIDIPDARYSKDLFAKYDFLKQTAIAYWRQFTESNPEIYKRVCNYRKDIDFSTLIVDSENPTALYFDKNSARRIGLFSYYVDQNGVPFYKRTSTNE